MIDKTERAELCKCITINEGSVGEDIESAQPRTCERENGTIFSVYKRPQANQIGAEHGVFFKKKKKTLLLRPGSYVVFLLC